jgi:hypothetical protein
MQHILNAQLSQILSPHYLSPHQRLIACKRHQPIAWLESRKAIYSLWRRVWWSPDSLTQALRQCPDFAVSVLVQKQVATVLHRTVMIQAQGQCMVAHTEIHTPSVAIVRRLSAQLHKIGSLGDWLFAQPMRILPVRYGDSPSGLERRRAFQLQGGIHVVIVEQWLGCAS